MTDRHNLIAYLSTIASIVLLSVCATAVCLFARVDSEVNLARIIGGLAFISAAIAGLTGIAGTFKASAPKSVTIDNPPGDPVQTQEAPKGVAPGDYRP